MCAEVGYIFQLNTMIETDAIKLATLHLDEDLLKGIVGGVKKDENEVQVVGELHLELTIHDEDVHEEIALEPSCESSDTSTFASQIVDKPCDELELVHSTFHHLQ